MQKQELTKQNEKLKKQEEELEAQKNSLTKLNTTKDKLFSIIAHDLKNPFYGISNFASLLSRRFDKYSHDQKLEIINLMKNASDNANELLENLLQWSRLNTNRVKFHPEQINLMSIVNSNIKFFDILAKNKEISMHASGKDVMAYADYDMVNTIIRNLVNNAIKFSHSNGNVQLNVEEDTEHAIVKVIDDGIGMDEQTRDKIFNLNMHVANTGTSGEVGTGLGLVLCKEFIEQNNGTIHVESEIGKGTTFILKLPKAE
jgi:signal transduction histidine kinase